MIVNWFLHLAIMLVSAVLLDDTVWERYAGIVAAIPRDAIITMFNVTNESCCAAQRR